MISLSEKNFEKYSRQLIMDRIGESGQKKIMNSSICIIGCGGLGTTTAQYLAMTGIGKMLLIDFDKVEISNLNRQLSYLEKDIGENKAEVLKRNIQKINPESDVNIIKKKITNKNINSLVKDYKFVIDCSDNFKTKFLINDFCVKLKKKLVTGAISKFDGHVFTFDFNDKKTASLKSFYQENEISDNDLNCEFEGVLGTTASIVGTTQANEALKMIMKIGQTLKNQILIIDLLNLNFRKVKFNRK